MKNIIKYTIGMFVLSTLFFACTKDDAVVFDEFPFEIEIVQKDTVTVNYPEKTVFKIITETPVSSNVYMFKYESLNGTGIYTNLNNDTIPENQFITLDSLSLEVNYISNNVDSDKIRATIKRGDEEKVKDLLYEVENNEYSLDLSTAITEIDINEIRPFSYDLFNKGKDKNVTYKRALYIINGSGVVLNADESEEIKLAEFENSVEGKFNYNVKFKEKGNPKLVIVGEDSNGYIKRDTLSYTVEEPPIRFSVTTSPNSTTIGSPYRFNFIIPENQGTTTTNKIRYTIQSGSANITYNSTPVNPNEQVDVPLSGSFYFDAVSNSEQTLNITFYLENGGVEVDRTASINIVGGTFALSAIPEVSQAEAGSQVGINCIITESGPTGAPYSLVYSSTETGNIEYRGTVYAPGSVIDGITDLTFSLKYLGVNEANHRLSFTLRDKNGNPFEATEQNINFINTQHTFSAASTGTTAFTDTPTNIVMELNGLSTLTYTMKWTADVSGTFVLNGISYPTNTPILVSPGNFTGAFIGTSPGRSNLTFEVTSSSGKTASDDVDLTINEFTFNFDVPEVLDVVAGNTAEFDINYTASNNNVSARVFYSINTNNGSVKRRENSQTLNSPFDLTQGTIGLRFDYSEVKTYVITWSYTNSNGASRDYETEVRVRNRDFSISINPVTNISFGSDVIVDLNLSSQQSPLTYRLDGYSFSQSGMTLRNQNNSIVGNSQSIGFGNNRFLASGYNTNSFSITIYVIDSFGQRKSVSRTFSINAPNEEYTSDIGRRSVNCGVQAGEQRIYYIYTRRISLKNNNGGVINRVQVYDENNNLINDARNLSIEPNETEIIGETTCQTNCSLGPGPCTPLGRFKIRYRIGNSWTEFKNVNL
ncbi:hypothetical protein [Aquimarina mytili]|uniref:DUF3872 domain-containing protein n=1 Tax=Aquimarina mytili TaxID=874423 RepID=A0A936ZWQ4_9FLAO|nr:hypothetical protein [Aquimarina mytili]MBL0686073.1 hypothetical protein [Aquimarina mytili]